MFIINIKWENDFRLTKMDLKMIAPAPAWDDSNISTAKKTNEQEQDEQDECSNVIARFTQETSFSGLKYVGNVNNHLIRR